MFNRVNEYFIITTINLRALEEITVWIYQKLRMSYFLQIETFPNLTVYRICIRITRKPDFDKILEQQIREHLLSMHIDIFKKEESC